MGDILQPEPVLPLLAAFSRYDDALAWARRRAQEILGPLAIESAAFAFSDTDYYQPTMGPALKKQFFAFKLPADPVALIQWKRMTNQWEAEFAAENQYAESRPLNLDPGYITLGKLVLASTKDHAHRIYLGEGIFAEVTLHFKHGAWQHTQWTFPDYRRDDYQEFFLACREHFRQLRKELRR